MSLPSFLQYFRTLALLAVASLSLTRGADENPPDIKKGDELAHIYCQACHLFPEPDLLDKKTWVTQTLKQMAPFLGVAKIDLARKPDGAILKEANVYPAQPLISREDWFAIIHYYEAKAPLEPLPQSPRGPIRMSLSQFEPKFPRYTNAVPMTCLVQFEPNTKSLFVGDATRHTLDILTREGRLQRTLDLDSGPVSLAQRGSAYYAALIGRIFPSDELAGKIVEIDGLTGGGAPNIKSIVSGVPRPTDIQFADFNGDGREDFVLCMFGNRLGRFSWFENKGTSYEEHVLLERAGAIRSYVLDANKDGLPDIMVLMAQAREGIYLFINQGKGSFTMRPLIEVHPAFGFSYFELADFNHDGFPDILATNGDNGDYPSRMKNYHGIRIYLNDGEFHFTEKWFYPLNGAFKAMAADFDGDGDLDIAAISFFPDYLKSPEESFVYLENKGDLKFEASSFPESTGGRWLTMDVRTMEKGGLPDIVLGSFVRGPMSIPVPADLQRQWLTNNLPVVVLENKGRTGSRK